MTKLLLRGISTLVLAATVCIWTGSARGDADLPFAPYGELLDQHLVEYDLPGGGLISAFDYRAALDDPATPELLARQSRLLAAFDRAQLDQREAAIAFWTNAYNFFMIRFLLEQAAAAGELAGSVRGYGSLVDPFALFKRALFEVGGRTYSLCEIELDVLLGDEFAARGWKDARVHFMVNCASVGCPPLRAVPYTATNVEAMMAENTRRALDTPIHLRPEGERLLVTSLFDWYAADFAAQNGSIEGFIRAHGSERARRRLERAAGIAFIDYDWAL
ncbi:MAG: DUF547 domain-containing protein, partial [Wenzhouxiangellaceae bacterium]|nr:DUF547 domain-containing protein [Wenzhouxiangellaceae bacterium]